jgi:hypothetical protein
MQAPNRRHRARIFRTSEGVIPHSCDRFLAFSIPSVPAGDTAGFVRSIWGQEISMSRVADPVSPAFDAIAKGAQDRLHKVLMWLAAAVGVAAGTYATLVGRAWIGYGHPSPPSAEDADSLLEGFMPVYDVAERHRIRIDAPAEIVFAAACEADLMRSTLVRAIFKTREMILGSTAEDAAQPRGLLALTTSQGWGVLDEHPGREVVVGAVTQPWKANVVFRAIAPAEFAAFDEPGYVKIVWTLRADPIGTAASVFKTETRALATDAAARRAFKRYWSVFSPGIVAIRWMMLGPVKAEAERRARATEAAYCR